MRILCLPIRSERPHGYPESQGHMMRLRRPTQLKDTRAELQSIEYKHSTAHRGGCLTQNCGCIYDRERPVDSGIHHHIPPLYVVFRMKAVSYNFLIVKTSPFGSPWGPTADPAPLTFDGQPAILPASPRLRGRGPYSRAASPRGRAG